MNLVRSFVAMLFGAFKLLLVSVMVGAIAGVDFAIGFFRVVGIVGLITFVCSRGDGSSDDSAVDASTTYLS